MIKTARAVMAMDLSFPWINSSHIKKFLTLGLALILMACSGSNTDVLSESVAVAQDGTELSITMVNSSDQTTNTVERRESNTVIATVLSSTGSPVAGQVVTFSTDFGVLVPDSGTALTDNNGKAQVQLEAGSSIGAGKVQAITAAGSEQLTVFYGFSVQGLDGTTEDTTLDTDPPTDIADATTTSQSVTGSIEFVSATPSLLALRGTGGEGLTEFSEVTFRLIGSDGLPMESRTVNFELNTLVGGIDIDPATTTSNSEGLAKTIVQAGTIPTAIRVTAITDMLDVDDNTITVFTQSDKLVVSTGIPDQNSMSLALSTINPEAANYVGEEVDVTVRLADHFNNYVPDGTTVYFTAEGGAIEPSCQTTAGGCSVKWVSQAPVPDDHRVTILATTLGNESFIDTDSDGRYSFADGDPYIDKNHNNIFDEAFTDDNSNGVYDEPFFDAPNGIYDAGEAFVDALNGRYDVDELFTDKGNGQYDPGETYTDSNTNGQFDPDEPYIDSIGNGIWDPGEDFIDALNGVYDFGESFTDVPNGKYDIEEFFVDYNGNGVYDGEGNNPTGETTFVDSNGNSEYDGAGISGQEETYTDANANTAFDGPGFADLGEPYLDINENDNKDPGEMYVDTDTDGVFDSQGDSNYNGILCTENNNCSTQQTIHIRDSAVLITSGSHALITARSASENIIHNTNDPAFFQDISMPTIDVSFGRYHTINAFIYDIAGQIMPAGTKIEVKTSAGTVGGDTSITVGNSSGGGLVGIRSSNSTLYETAYNMGTGIGFSIEDDDPAKSDSGVITITVTTPKGIQRSISIGVVM